MCNNCDFADALESAYGDRLVGFRSDEDLPGAVIAAVALDNTGEDDEPLVQFFFNADEPEVFVVAPDKNRRNRLIESVDYQALVVKISNIDDGEYFLTAVCQDDH